MAESVEQRTIVGNRDGAAAARATFSDVVRAHYDWDCERDGAARAPARETFEQALSRFERAIARSPETERTRVVDSYWCRKQASGVALVELPQPEPRSRLARLWMRDRTPQYEIYRETDWVTTEFSQLTNLLHQADVLAVKARWGLEKLQQAVVMQWLYAVETHILAFVESQWRLDERAGLERPARGSEPDSVPSVARTPAADGETPDARSDERESFHATTLQQLNSIETYYHEAGEKRGRLHYVAGMLLLGAPAVVLSALLAAGGLALFGFRDLHQPTMRQFYASVVAGALGAIVSVLMRMSGGGFAIDHELGAVGVRRLGAFRPVIGAICGAVVYLLVQTTLVPIDDKAQTFEFYVVVAFLAGFSERWTRVVLSGAMRTIQGVEAEPGASETAPGAPAAGTSRVDGRASAAALRERRERV